MISWHSWRKPTPQRCQWPTLPQDAQSATCEGFCSYVSLSVKWTNTYTYHHQWRVEGSERMDWNGMSSFVSILYSVRYVYSTQGQVPRVGTQGVCSKDLWLFARGSLTQLSEEQIKALYESRNATSIFWTLGHGNEGWGRHGHGHLRFQTPTCAVVCLAVCTLA